jgi:hypothetical protein
MHKYSNSYSLNLNLKTLFSRNTYITSSVSSTVAYVAAELAALHIHELPESGLVYQTRCEQELS